MLSRALKHKTDVPKSKELKGVRSTKDVDSLLWEMEQYFYVIGNMEDAIKVNTTSFYFLLLWCRRYTDEK